MQLRSAQRVARAASAAVVLLGAPACERQTGVPDAPSLVGEWVLSGVSLAMARTMGFERSGASDHRVVLAADGSCQFRSYWYFAGTPKELREADYIAGSSRCSWSVRDTVVAARRSTIEGALEIVVSEPLVAYVDLEVERVEGELFLVASTGHPDENGAKFRYERARP